MSDFPDSPKPNWHYARFVYEKVRLSGIKAGDRIMVTDDLSVEIPKAKPKEVWFFGADGKRVAWIPCPCTGVKVINFDDRSIQGNEKLAKYHEIASFVKAKFS